jgi:hypothetical protein
MIINHHGNTSKGWGGAAMSLKAAPLDRVSSSTQPTADFLKEFCRHLSGRGG